MLQPRTSRGPDTSRRPVLHEHDDLQIFALPLGIHEKRNGPGEARAAVSGLGAIYTQAIAKGALGVVGLSQIGIQRALEKNLRRGKPVAGGSTISQQLAKNLFLSGERSYWRKAQEALITAMLELLMDKLQRLTLQALRQSSRPAVKDMPAQGDMPPP